MTIENISKLNLIKGQNKTILWYSKLLRNFQDWFMEDVKNLEKIPKVFKRKGIHYCLPHLFSNIFPALQASKQKWWSVLTCYYKPHQYFGKVWLKKNQVHHKLKISKNTIQKNSNELLLETFSKWAKIYTNVSVW